MKLSYRGVQYDYNPVPVETSESDVSGQYRGSHYKVSYPRHIPVPQPVLNLKYRGVAYRTAETAETPSVASPVGCPEAAIPAFTHPAKLLRRAILSETAKLHRQNIQRSLQHRMEVAKTKGDRSLLAQLEREMKQFV